MKITTRAVYQMTEVPGEYILLEEDAHEYDGPVSEAKGGGTQTVQQNADPWKEVQPYLKEGFANLDQAAQNIPNYFPGQTYASFDPAQEAAYSGMLDWAQSPMLAGSIGNQLNALNFGTNAVMDPASNQALAAHVQSAIRPLTQSYQEQVLPGIRDQAEMYGGAGSRTGLAEGVASRGYMDAIAATAAPMYSQAYGQGLDQQARMMALAPQTMQMGMMPFNIMDQVGGQYQGMTQNAINEAMARYDYENNAEYNRWGDYINTLQGTPWGSSTSTGPNPNASNPLMGALGGAGLGLGTAAMLAPAGTFAAGGGGMAAAMAAPWAWPLVIGGGLLGAFG